MRKTSRILSVILSLIFAFSFFGCQRESGEFRYSSASVSGVDALGRVTAAAGNEIENRDVGLFYFLWLGAHASGIYDITDLLENNPDELWDPNSKISPQGAYHFWGEPLYGYYHSADPWVLTRHVELFTMAGIDFLAFDVTNGPIYENVVRELLKILDRYQKQGFDVPKVMFLTNSGTVSTVTNVYNAFYREDSEYYYPNLWYAPEGKPMIGGAPRRFTGENAFYTEFFDMRNVDWPNAIVHDEEDFPWMSWVYPQTNFNGIMSVSVAQHVVSRMSLQEANWGRGFDQVDNLNHSDKVAEGHNISQQWDSVFATFDDENQIDVHTVFVTGWNEWIAIKFAEPDVYFVDTFNEEYSRDIEMMKGGYGDNYFMQLVQKIRQYKYEGETNFVRNNGKAAEGDWSGAWEYLDFVGDAMERDSVGYISSLRYTDDSNRNDIARIQVAHDGNNLYFRIETADPLTAYEEGDTTYMNLWLATDNQSDFSYVVNHTYGKISAITEDGYRVIGDVTVGTDQNVMTITVPKNLIGGKDAVRFRVSDHVDASDRMNFYIQGDSAPIGGLSYTYGVVR